MVVKAVPIVYTKCEVMMEKVKLVHAPEKNLLVSVDTANISKKSSHGFTTFKVKVRVYLI